MPEETKDLFGEPLESHSPAWSAALAKPNLNELIATLQLMASLSPVLRGDNQTGGWSTLTDGLPAFFPLSMDHNSRVPLAVFAGLVNDPAFEKLGLELPSVREISGAQRRIASEALPRFEDAVRLLRKIAGLEP